jgi:KUP system potassium uptake protein
VRGHLVSVPVRYLRARSPDDDFPHSANLGQFTASSIRISFLCLVYPALIFQYLGQGARIITDGTVMANPFYLSIPGGPNGGLWWITWVMGVIASVSHAQVYQNFNRIET